ncbi:MAG: cadherin-like domain-containing protein, partial [Cyanobacteria bacterium J06607_6]
TDADGDDLSAAIAAAPSNGTAELNANGSFTYTPNSGFSGDDSFTYTADDGNGGTAEATVTVTVEGDTTPPPPVNTAPEAGDDSYSTAFDTALTIAADAGVLSTDSDADGDTLTAALAAGPANGSVEVSGDGSFVYTPNAGFSGDDSFTYTADDGNGGTAEATVTVTVEGDTTPPPPVNTAPEAGDDSYSTAFD